MAADPASNRNWRRALGMSLAAFYLPCIPWALALLARQNFHDLWIVPILPGVLAGFLISDVSGVDTQPLGYAVAAVIAGVTIVISTIIGNRSERARRVAASVTLLLS